jgi:hypothetical protein
VPYTGGTCRWTKCSTGSMRPAGVELVLTGRQAPAEILARAQPGDPCGETEASLRRRVPAGGESSTEMACDLHHGGA